MLIHTVKAFLKKGVVVCMQSQLVTKMRTWGWGTIDFCLKGTLVFHSVGRTLWTHTANALLALSQPAV